MSYSYGTCEYAAGGYADIRPRYIITRTPSDTQTFSESAARARGANGNLSEPLTLSELVDRLGAFGRTPSDTLALSDASARQGAFGRTITSVLSASDAIVGAARILKNALLAVTLKDYLGGITVTWKDAKSLVATVGFGITSTVKQILGISITEGFKE